MSDIRKSNMLRCFLWLVCIGVIAFVVSIADALLDLLPIWPLSQGHSHFLIECAVFWATVAGVVWRWLARRVWIASLPASSVSRPHQPTPKEGI